MRRSLAVMLLLLAIPALVRSQVRDDIVDRQIQRAWNRVDREQARNDRLAEARVNRAQVARERADRQRAVRERAAQERQARLWNQQDRARERQLDREERLRQRSEDAEFRRQLRFRYRP